MSDFGMNPNERYVQIEATEIGFTDTHIYATRKLTLVTDIPKSHPAHPDNGTYFMGGKL